MKKQIQESINFLIKEFKRLKKLEEEINNQIDRIENNKNTEKK